jgi:hypothetical protein
LYDVYNPACTEIIDTTVTLIPLPMQWQGGVSGSETDWTAPGNWSCGFVPTVTDNVLIPAGTTYLPVLDVSGTGVTLNLDVAAGAGITLNSGATLTVGGDLMNNGNITGDGTLTLNGVALHHLGGLGSVDNLQLNDSHGATIDAASRVTVNNTLTISNGNLSTNDSLVLGSDTLTSARLAPVAAGSTITGTTRVLQGIQGSYRRYRFWSHPFTDAIALNQMQQYIDVTGRGGATNGFTSTASNAPSAYRYNTLQGNSSMSYDPGWKAFTSALATAADSNLIHRYQGIRVYMRGAKGEGLGYTPYAPSATVIGQVGTLNVGRQEITLIKGTAVQDYNLLGNPYASPVDLGTAAYRAKVSGNIIGSYYVWNPTLGAGGQFESVPVSTVSAVPYFIQANTAFEVRAANNGDSLVFYESDKGTTATATLLRTLPGYTTLYIYDAGYHPWDMLHIRFDSATTDAQDLVNDADKLVGGDLNFYSLSSDGKRQAIDVRPYSQSAVIPLGITSEYSQEFIIKAESIVTPDGGQLYLHDKWLQQYVALSKGSEYHFTIGKDKESQGNDRFELSMKPNNLPNGAQFSMAMVPNPAQDEVVLSYNTGVVTGDVSVTVTNLSGVTVFTKALGNRQSGTVTLPVHNLSAGVYLVELHNGDRKTVQRLIKE